MSASIGGSRTNQLDTWMCIGAAIAIVMAASLPYWLAYRVPGDYVFTGLLVNPLDGNTYLAKMREGWAGSWLFTLPYTQEPGPGAFILTYYLFLGRVARWLNASLDFVYHAARVLGGLSLLLTAWVFLGYFLPGRRARWAAWLLFALGSGLGWLVVAFDYFTADLLVAEAFPFLTLLANAHFALALALALWVLRWALPGLPPPKDARWGWLALAAATVALALVQPLGLIGAGLVIAGVAGWHAAAMRSLRPLFATPVLIFGAIAAPWVAYVAALTQWHPTLALWNAQNLTPSPPLWDAALAGGVPLALAVVGLVRAARRRSPLDIILVVWLGLGGLALYVPFALQRRLAMGLWVPVCVLAVQALRDVVWPRLKPGLRPVLIGLLGLLVVPSNLLVYAATLGAVAARDAAVFWTADEAAALDWLAANAGATDTVAASPEMGLFIPARTPARVLYGHPFETINAAAQEQLLLDFYAGRVSPDEFVQAHGVRYVLDGTGTGDVTGAQWPAEWPVVFESGTVVIYAP